MNKQFISTIITNLFDYEKNYNKIKKFKNSKRKKKFIRTKYPHRKSDSTRKSLVTLKYYLNKHKKWYTAKKKCLTFINFVKPYLSEEIDIDDENIKKLVCYYCED